MRCEPLLNGEWPDPLLKVSRIHIYPRMNTEAAAELLASGLFAGRHRMKWLSETVLRAELGGVLNSRYHVGGPD